MVTSTHTDKHTHKIYSCKREKKKKKREREREKQHLQK